MNVSKTKKNYSKAYRIPSEFEVRKVFHPEGCERIHIHSELTLTAVSQGSLSLGNNRILERNRTAIILPGQQHFVEYYSENIESVYVLYINNISSLTSENLKTGPQVIQDHQLYESFLDICSFLLGKSSDKLKQKALNTWIMEHLSNRLESTSGRFPDNSRSGLAESIKKILDNYYGERVPLNAIADAFGRSKIYCNRAFKAVYNLSIQTYFLNLKAHRAKELLWSSGNSPGRIAMESGFYDQSHFTRIFKEIFQMTPEEFRKAGKF